VRRLPKLSLDFRPYTPANYFKTLQILSSDPNQGPEPLSLGELGEGSRNTVLLALLISYAAHFRAGAGLLALEEPELYLHPHARRHLFRTLKELLNSGQQVILSTHSDSFLDTELFDSVGRVLKVRSEQDLTRVETKLRTVTRKQMAHFWRETGGTKASEETVAEYYRTTSVPRLNEGFFARVVLLVEGETEELALPEYCHQLGLDLDKLGVSVLAVGGKQSLAKYWRLYASFGIPTVLVVDNDEDEATNQSLAKALSLPANSFVDGVEHSKVLVSPRVGGTPIVVVAKDFETSLRNSIGEWYSAEGLDPTPFEELCQKCVEAPMSKGMAARVFARWIARNLPEFVPPVVRDIAREIQQIVETASGSAA
jgi:putative ATP-dependent endonuclease of the OLD family